MTDETRGRNARLHIDRVHNHLKWILTYDMGGMIDLRLAICPASLSFAEAVEKARTLFDIEGRIVGFEAQGLINAGRKDGR